MHVLSCCWLQERWFESKGFVCDDVCFEFLFIATVVPWLVRHQEFELW